MEIFILVVGFLCMLAGLAGSVLPVLPGPPLTYIGMLVLQVSDRVQFSTTTLVVALVLVVISLVLDYIAPIIGTKYYGGGKWGEWGCVVGTILGLFVFPPWGFILGPLVGAIVGELLQGKDSNAAIKAGFGAFIGFFFGIDCQIAYLSVLDLSSCGSGLVKKANA